VTILVGDCLKVMPRLEADSVDSVVVDPPYGIGFMGKSWDHRDIVSRAEKRAGQAQSKDRNGKDRKAPRRALAEVAGAYDLSPKGMRAFQQFSADWAREAIRVLKPGGYLVSFASPRTFHRMVCGIEEAGFEIRDTLMWLFGSGFPKSHNLGGEWQGWGTALKPGYEPIVLARKPFKGTVAANVAEHGTSALNIDGCRIETGEHLGGGAYVANGQRSVSPALSPTGMNRPGATAGEFQQPTGRWPANVVHDGSDEVLACFPEAPGQVASASASNRERQNTYGSMRVGSGGGAPRGDFGSAARFFYCAKASREDRNEGCEGLPLRQSGMVSNTSGQHVTRRDGGAPDPAANHHPTVKPTDLMRWLCRLVTPPGGLILDPFTGSGSTGKAASLEGFRFVGIELDATYAAIAERRIHATQPGPALGVVHE
jgi:DNA modification methylase